MNTIEQLLQEIGREELDRLLELKRPKKPAKKSNWPFINVWLIICFLMLAFLSVGGEFYDNSDDEKNLSKAKRLVNKDAIRKTKFAQDSGNITSMFLQSKEKKKTKGKYLKVYLFYLNLNILFFIFRLEFVLFFSNILLTFCSLINCLLFS